jgi:hypothetical protein
VESKHVSPQLLVPECIVAKDALAVGGVARAEVDRLLFVAATDKQQRGEAEGKGSLHDNPP